MLPNEKKFAILSKRFVFYDTCNVDDITLVNKSSLGAVGEHHAIHAEFNRYYLNFVVVSK